MKNKIRGGGDDQILVFADFYIRREISSERVVMSSSHLKLRSDVLVRSYDRFDLAEIR